MTHITTTPTAVRLADVQPPAGWVASWERKKRGNVAVHWAVEFIAEAFGVFLYTYAGTGSTAAFVLGNLAQQTNLGSLFQVGMAYAIGVVLALTLCSRVSEGHFSSGITLVMVALRKCTPARGLRLIIAQILGAYIACMLIYVQYKDLIEPIEAALKASGNYDAIQFTPNGPAGVFALYTPAHANLGHVFLNEFVTDFVLGVAIFGSLDPTNTLIPPAMAPWTIAFTYAFVIWGYAPAALAANSARDVGGRLAALTIWGKAASGGRYAAIAALTNIPATTLAVFFYQLLLGDSSRLLPAAHQEHLALTRAHSSEESEMTHSVESLNDKQV
ncbi:hypothetical protein QCA50_011633 [Cerrena zonata]|uniref:Aquaporin-like protein n=1 Tax=Cerrena zonata TaxID=2478898 RepID=A0AAW0G8A7_9APHY